jgi:integrase
MPPAVSLAGKDVIVALTDKQAKKLVAHKGDGIPEVRRVPNLFALCTGLRVREIAGLSWGHIDTRDKLVRVVRQLKTSGETPTFKPPKRDSKRTIPLHPSLVTALSTRFATASATTTSGSRRLPKPTPARKSSLRRRR